MPENQSDPPPDPLLKARGAPRQTRSLAGLAMGLTGLWAALLAVYWFVLPEAARQTLLPADGIMAWLVRGVGIALPVALVWVGLGALQQMAALRAEAMALRAQIDQLKAAARPVSRAELRAPVTPLPPKTPARSPAKPIAETQPSLALGPAPEAVPVPLAIAIRALNFPEDAEDREGFRALRIALENRALAKLIRAAQDVLTLLSQDAIYVDDLPARDTPPDLWRRFANGARGAEVAGLAGIEDAASLTHIAARMRADTIFRDAAHHFVRQFDRSLGEFEPLASDAEMAALAETRSARAFMLIGRVMGIFD